MAKITKIGDNVPSQDVLEERFFFIKNSTLRSNVAIAFRYIIFQLELLHETRIASAIKYSIYKDIILYTATIVESCMHYLIKTHTDGGIIDYKNIMGWEWKNETKKELYKISRDRKVCGVVIHKSYKKLSHNTLFDELNKCAKRADLITPIMFNRLDELRIKRNKIHLAGLQEIDDYYQDKDIQECFNIAKEVIEHIEKLCNKISNDSQ